jgi:hypothetical protein
VSLFIRIIHCFICILLTSGLTGAASCTATVLVNDASMNVTLRRTASLTSWLDLDTKSAFWLGRGNNRIRPVSPSRSILCI